MLGFTFDYGPFVAFVSEWQENGTATEFSEGKSLDIICKIVRTSFCYRNLLGSECEQLQGAASGLAYLHSKGIVHGDFRGVGLVCQKFHNAFLIVLRTTF